MFPERAGVVRGNVVFPWEAFFEAKEAGRGTVAVGTTVFGTADVAMIFVDGCDVGAAAFSTCQEGFRAFAVRDSVS
jgi:hypothetical protein